MAQANSHHNTRRGFVALAAAAATAVMSKPQPAFAGHDPVYAAIETYEKAYVECRAAVSESNRLCALADKVAGKHEVIIPDLRGPNAPDGGWLLPMAYERDGQKYVVARTTHSINEYLPGEENEHLRQSFTKRLDEINGAREAVYGDIDEVVNGPAAAEYWAANELVETVPTTLPGLMAFLLCLAKLHERDPDMLNENNIGPLVTGLGAAAAALS